MSNLMLRASAASAAATVLIGVWFWSHLPVSEAADPGHPLPKTASLHPLTEDGRIGKVTDVQGIVAIRPGMAQRWSPLVDRMIVRTRRLGAHRPPRRQRRLLAVGRAVRPGLRSRDARGAGLTAADPHRGRRTAGGGLGEATPGACGTRRPRDGRRGPAVLSRGETKLVRVEKEPPWLRATRARPPTSRSARSWRRLTGATCR